MTTAQRRADEAEQAQRLAERQTREATAARDAAQEELARVLAERDAAAPAESPTPALAEPAVESPPKPTPERPDDGQRSQREIHDSSGGGALSLFSGSLTSEPSLTGDGSDAGVLPIALGGTAVVTLMVTVLALLNGRLFSPFGIVMVVITVGLAYFAWQTRVERIEVHVSEGGVVYVERSGSGAMRFDLSNDGTRVSMSGSPEDSEWSITFDRGGVDPFTVNATMVDPADFVRRIRAFRTDL